MPIIQYGKECKDDDDCETKVCEMTYDNATEKPKGRFCLQVNQEYGKICNKICNKIYNGKNNAIKTEHNMQLLPTQIN